MNEAADIPLDVELGHELAELLDRAAALEKFPLARLVSIFESQSPADSAKRHALIKEVERRADGRSPAWVIGISGPPGAGKSSLVGEVCSQIIEKNPNVSVAVLAVDPSSGISGGALLGDRTRTRFPLGEKRLFFRSQPSRLELGGVSSATFQVARLLRHLFDYLIIETVGVGQSELDIRDLADYLVLVMQPLSGDQVQFLKAGIMEMPDLFVINKCDEEVLARKSLSLLRSGLKIAGMVDGQSNKGDLAERLLATSTVSGDGIDQLCQRLLKLPLAGPPQSDLWAETERCFLERWLRQEYGRVGLARCEQTLGTLSGKTIEESQQMLRKQLS